MVEAKWSLCNTSHSQRSNDGGILWWLMQSSLALRCFWNTTRALLSLSHKWEVLQFLKLFQQSPLHLLHRESSSKSPPPPKILHLLQALHLPIWVCNLLGGLGWGLASKIENGKVEPRCQEQGAGSYEALGRVHEQDVYIYMYYIKAIFPSLFKMSTYSVYIYIYIYSTPPLSNSLFYIQNNNIYGSSSSICFVHRENWNQT